jgi:hypothetical protein
MTNAHYLPTEILAQHVAVLGKTGSGKTSTAKLAIEQVVAEGARVCVLDPIKSDWWGLTSSANGKHAGLPFHILGGPHGHVPLHSAAGKAIADVVATGTLPLSIIDMADFEPGGQARFFVDFAPTLLRKMRGVVYLVIEEAHLFAPKERSGIGAENLSIHWAKTMATAGRSKGVRLVLVTQRTQALHNALLGSCDTLIAHRLTAPADQKPVVQWLQANTSKEVLEQVAGSLASLKTGEAWVCSGEARLFERMAFGRISTYDNTATPTGDAAVRDVKTAPVDEEKLRAIIGAAVDQAKADDPRELRKQVLELKQQVEQAGKQSAQTQLTRQVNNRPVLTDADRALLEKVATRITEAASLHHEDLVLAIERLKSALSLVNGEYVAKVIETTERAQRQMQAVFEATRVVQLFTKLATATPAAAPQVPPPPRAERPPPARHDRRAAVEGVDAYQSDVLRALAQLQALGLSNPPKLHAAALANKSIRSSTWDSKVADLNKRGLVRYGTGGTLSITPEGLALVGDQPQVSGRELLDGYRNILSDYQNALLSPLLKHPTQPFTREEWAAAAGKSRTSSTFDNEAASMVALGVVEIPGPGTVRLTPRLAEWV